MGDVKDNMESDKLERKGVLGRFVRRQRKESPETFAEMIEVADRTLDDLVRKKKIDKENENGDFEYNEKAVAYLETMRFHLDCIIDLAASYGELRDEDE